MDPRMNPSGNYHSPPQPDPVSGTASPAAPLPSQPQRSFSAPSQQYTAQQYGHAAETYHPQSYHALSQAQIQQPCLPQTTYQTAQSPDSSDTGAEIIQALLSDEGITELNPLSWLQSNTGPPPDTRQQPPPDTYSASQPPEPSNAGATLVQALLSDENTFEQNAISFLQSAPWRSASWQSTTQQSTPSQSTTRQLPETQQQPPPFQQRPSFTLSGKKTSAWLKKNVTPRLSEVAKSSIVQGSIKELNHAYTSARDKYYAAQASAPYNQPPSTATTTQPGPAWESRLSQGQQQTYAQPVHQKPEAVPAPSTYSMPASPPAATQAATSSQYAQSGPYSQANHQVPASNTMNPTPSMPPASYAQAPPQLHEPPIHPSQQTAAYSPALAKPPPKIGRKPINVTQKPVPVVEVVARQATMTTQIHPAKEEDRSKGYILTIDHERNKAIRVIRGLDGNDTYVVEDYQAPPAEQPALAAVPPPATEPGATTTAEVAGEQPLLSNDPAPQLHNANSFGWDSRHQEHAHVEQIPGPGAVAFASNPRYQEPLPIPHQGLNTSAPNYENLSNSLPEGYEDPTISPVPRQPDPSFAPIPRDQDASFAPVPQQEHPAIAPDSWYDGSVSATDMRYQDPVSSTFFGAANDSEAVQNPQPSPPELAENSGLLSSIISSVSQLQISSTAIPRVAGDGHGQNLDVLYDPLALATPITASGTPSSPLRCCPQTRIVQYSTTWYYLKGQPEFGICSWCFSKYIASSSLTHESEKTVKTGGSCRFNVPRVTKSLWPEAQTNGSLDRLRDYMSRRLSIPDCKKKAGAVATDGIKWFRFTRDELPGMAVCEACHEDLVLATSFDDRFAPRPQPADARFVCDMTPAYLPRALEILSQRGDQETAWGEFVKAVEKRAFLPACEEQAVLATSRNWYRPKQHVANLDFCEACFLDSFGMTPLADHFAETGESFEQKLYMRTCDLQLVNLGECVYVCRTKGLGIDFLLQAAARIASSPRCFKKTDIVDGRFYNFASGAAANFGICEGCHAGILAPHGVDHFFASEPQLVAGPAYCAFNPSVARFSQYVASWQEATETGFWNSYETWVRKFAALPVCPNFNLAANRKWYGWHDCTICQDCFQAVADGTSLVGAMELHETPLEEEKLCCLYSDRMRAKYQEACEVGDPTELRAFSRRRWEVYQQTVPRFKMLFQMQSMQQSLAMSQMMLSQSYQHANAMSDWVSPSQYEYGNSSTGYHSSQYGVDAAQAWDEGQASFARARGPVAEAGYLQTVWKAVE